MKHFLVEIPCIVHETDSALRPLDSTGYAYPIRFFVSGANTAPEARVMVVNALRGLVEGEPPDSQA